MKFNFTTGPFDGRRRVALGVAGLALAGLGLPARAQNRRPLRFVVPLPPGSGVDTIARLVATKVGEYTSQPAVVENKPGAAGFLAVQAVLGAPADGHMVLVVGNSTLTINPVAFKNLPYDPAADFVPLKLFGGGYCLLLVPAASPYTKLSDLVADARSRPGALNYASGTTTYELYTEMFNQQAQIRTTRIPFKGTADAVNGIVSATADYAVVDATAAYELVRSGRIRALTFTGPSRSPLLPQVPTASESGFPKFDAFVWVAAFVSSKTKPEQVQQLRELFARAHKSTELQEFYARTGTVQSSLAPEQIQQFILDEMARMKTLAAAAGLQPQ
jgi:tripartite-type tricarboxylate transporter receptor subunit TctC